MSASLSWPMMATSDESAPSRAVATAWFEPLPPGPMSKLLPNMVTPKTGMFGARIVRPTAKLPTTVIFGAVIFGLAIDRSLLKETLGSQRAGEDRFLGDVGPGHLAGDHTIAHDEDACAV